MVGTSRSFEMIAMLVLGGEGTLVGRLLRGAVADAAADVFQPFALYKTAAEGALLVLSFCSAGRHIRRGWRLLSGRGRRSSSASEAASARSETR